MGKKRLPVKSKKKAKGKAAKRNVPVVKYALCIVVAVGIAFFWAPLSDISSSVQDAIRFTREGYSNLRNNKIRAAHRSFDEALAIAKKNNFIDRKPLLLADILMGKADTYGSAAVRKGIYHESAPPAIDLYWQAYRINKELDGLQRIAQLHMLLGNYKEQADVSQQILDTLIADPQKVTKLQGSQHAEKDFLVRTLLSKFMISLRNMGNADLAASYFWKMKHVFPEYITWKDTYQTPVSFDDRLNDKPWWDATGDWRREVEMHYEDILAELKHFLANDGAFKLATDPHLVGKRDSKEQVVADDWSEVMLWNGEFTEHCRAFPITCSLVQGIPQLTGTDSDGNFISGEVTILKLRGGSHLVPHCGPNNDRLTNHLGLIIPKGLSIRVANETRGWEQGKVIVFDDSFEHEVWHNGTEDRYVLYMSSWKKEFGKGLTPNRETSFW